MSLRKRGTPEKIHVVESKEASFAFDPNLIVTMLKEKWPEQQISLDQLHETVKTLGIVDYSSTDLDQLIMLLQSSGFSVTR
jgi:hypothetical protein